MRGGDTRPPPPARKGTGGVGTYVMLVLQLNMARCLSVGAAISCRKKQFDNDKIQVSTSDTHTAPDPGKSLRNSASASLVPNRGTATDHKQTKNEQRSYETGLSVTLYWRGEQAEGEEEATEMKVATSGWLLAPGNILTIARTLDLAVIRLRAAVEASTATSFTSTISTRGFTETANSTPP